MCVFKLNFKISSVLIGTLNTLAVLNHVTCLKTRLFKLTSASTNYNIYTQAHKTYVCVYIYIFMYIYHGC
jgi:hypothetical protein